MDLRGSGRPGQARSGAATFGRFKLVDRSVARRRVAAARVGRLATLTPEGRPHIVPCCFVLDAETVYSAVDAKPKSTLALRRLENVRAHPSCSLLVDQYSEEWTELWWVRIDGSGRVMEQGDERETALTLLKAKYRQYRETTPPAPWWPLTLHAGGCGHDIVTVPHRRRRSRGGQCRLGCSERTTLRRHSAQA